MARHSAAGSARFPLLDALLVALAGISLLVLLGLALWQGWA